MTATTSKLEASAFMFVLGLGIGSVMQVLVLAVQNAVDYADLGVATSGSCCSRSSGSARPRGSQDSSCSCSASASGW